MTNVPRLVLAAPESGSGKTTVTVGLVAAFRAQGLRVQPFKVGPDYIDPGYHALAAGRPCRNLDAWMLGPDAVRESFTCNTRAADIAVVEGVMGFFDGFGAQDNTGSTAEVAQLLRAPVILIVDARGMARSAAALVKGYHEFAPGLPLAGVILNRVGGEKHVEICTQAIESAAGVPVLGYLREDDALRLPQRHLGLVTTTEAGPWQNFIERAAHEVTATIKLERVLDVSRTALSLSCSPASTQWSPVANLEPPVRLAVAQDAAFSFTYPENIELLEEAGAVITCFSPLRDAALPEGVSGVVLSGGFPELYAADLSANVAMHHALRAAHERGVPIYAECGGLMALTEHIVDFDGRRWPMVGLLPGHSVMSGQATLGYRLVEALADGPLLAAGERVRGHEFHYSRWEGRPAGLSAAYHLLPPNGEPGDPSLAGARLGNLWASYIHLHFLAKPEMAQRFVAWCRARGEEAGR